LEGLLETPPNLAVNLYIWKIYITKVLKTKSMGFNPEAYAYAQTLMHPPITNVPREQLGTSAHVYYLKGEIRPEPRERGADRTTHGHKFRDDTVIIAGCRGHVNQDTILLRPESARVISEHGDSHFWVNRCHEFSGDVYFMIRALFLQLDFRMRYIYVLANILLLS
jgi:hypothetical protein